MASRRIISPLLLPLLLSSLSLSDARLQTRCNNNTTATTPAATCQVLYNTYPDLTSFPNETQYTTINEGYFTAAEWLGPACIFAPTSAELMSFGVKTLVDSGVPFALQGGGHMTVAGSANIDAAGILLSSTGLDQLILSEDGSTVSVGPGNHWADVYNFLEPSGKTIVGGRMGVVGVPGFLLGGGISFFSNEYGWASANIASFECVLADGSIVNATAVNEYSDLFWALRGGGNSFAIVTNFELKTLEVPGVTVGQIAYTGSDLRDQFLQATYDFAHNGSLDQKATVTPMANWIPAAYGYDNYHYSSMAFYSANDSNPTALANFTGGAGDTSLPVNSSTFSYRSMAKWAEETDANFAEQTHGFFFRFAVTSIVADLDTMGTVFDTFFDAVKPRMANVTGGGAGLAVMPIPKSYIVNNRGENVTADPMGIDASKAPYIWIEQTFLYALSSDTALVDSVITAANAAIDEVLDEAMRSPYLYLNDADKGQPVFEGYAPENLQRLKEIRAKYDPAGVYTRQMPGGWKVADV